MTSISDKERSVFSDNLSRIMLEKGKKQSDIVEKFGITASTVSDWVNGKKYPRMDKVQMLADWLGVKKSDLIEEKPQEETLELSEEEEQLILFFRSVPEEHRQMILAMIRTAIESLE